MKKSLSSTSLNNLNSINISSFNSSIGIRKSVSNNSLFSLDYELSSDKIHNEIEYMVSKMPITKLANCNLSKYINLPKAPSIQVDELETVGACLAEPCEIIEETNINLPNTPNTRYYWLERSLDEREIGIRHANLYARIRRKKNKI
jgi:hypothetical protein